jgi:hypothetical protein
LWSRLDYTIVRHPFPVLPNTVGGEKCSSCGTLSEGAGEKSENEVKAGVGVDDGVEDGIDIGVGVNVAGGEILLLLE